MANQDKDTDIAYGRANSLWCPLILILQERLNGEQMVYYNTTAAVALSHR